MQQASTLLHSQIETCKILKIGTFLKSSEIGYTLNHWRLAAQHRHFLPNHIQSVHEPTKQLFCSISQD